MGSEYLDLLKRIDKLQSDINGLRNELKDKLKLESEKKTIQQPAESIKAQKNISMPEETPRPVQSAPKTSPANKALDTVEKKPPVQIPKKDKNLQAGFWELLVGRQVISIAGILLVIAGLAYGVAYAYKHLHFPPEMRMIAAAVIAFALLTTGIIMCRNKRYRFFSLVLQGGGVAGLYITGFASYQLYHLLSATTAGTCLFIISMAAFALSALFNSQVIGVIGVIGAMAMPLLIRITELNHTFFLTYLLFVNLPAVILGFKKKWQSLYNISFYLTAIVGLVWMSSYCSKQYFALTLTFCFLFNIEYLVLALFILFEHKNETRKFGDLVRLVINTALLLWALNIAFDRAGCKDIIWTAYLVASALYCVFAALAYRFKPRMIGEILLYTGGSVVFLTLAVPAYFDGSMVAIIWNIEALCLAVFAGKIKSGNIARWAFIIALMGVFNAAFYNFEQQVFLTSLFINWQFGTILLCLLLSGAQACVNIYSSPKAFVGQALMAVAGWGLIFVVAVNTLFYFGVYEYAMLITAAIAIALALIWGYAAKGKFSFLEPYCKMTAGGPLAASLISLLLAVAVGNIPASSWYYVLWGLAGLLLYWGAPKTISLLPAAAAVAFTGIVKVFIFRSIYTAKFAAEPIFLNEHFFAGAVAVVLFMILYWRPWWRRNSKGPVELSSTREWMIPAAMVLTTVLLSQNAWHYYGGFTDIFRLFTTVAAAVCGMAVCIVAYFCGKRTWYRAGIFFFVLALIVIMLDVLGGNVSNNKVFGNHFFVIRLAVIALTLFGCFMNKNFSFNPREHALIALTGITAFLHLCVEEFTRLGTAWSNMAIVIFLTAAAVIICLIGLWKKIASLRLYSFVVLAIAVYWLIYRNLWGLKDPGRIFAFMGVGALLLILSFVYHKVAAIWLDK